MNLTRPFIITLLACLTSCERTIDEEQSAEWWRLEGEKRSLAAKVEILKLRANQSEAVDQKIATAQGTLEATVREVEQLRSEITRLENQTTELRNTVTIAANAKPWEERHNQLRGHQLETLTSAEGKTYHDVRISKVTDIGLEFSHSTGLARLTTRDLTTEHRNLFELDLQRSETLLLEEGQKQRAYAQWVQETYRTEQAVLRKEPVVAAILPATPYRPTHTPRLSSNPLDQPAKPFGSRSYENVTSSPNYYYIWNNRSTRRTRSTFTQPFNWTPSRRTPSAGAPDFRRPTPRTLTPRCPND